MSVMYKGPKPERNYTVSDFYNKGIIILWIRKFIDYNTKLPFIRCVFRSNGLLGEIRTTCCGNAYAVDVTWGWWSNEHTCLTTECKTLREAKSILFEWFRSKGYSIPTKNQKGTYMIFEGFQPTLSPFIFPK